METSEIIKKVRKIEIKTRGLSQNIFAGQYHSAFKGRGMAFSEVREYQYGDDVRDIDWNVTARFHHPYVKVFEEERELTVIFSDHIEKYIPPKKGRHHILYIIRELLDFKPKSVRTDIGMAVSYLTRMMKRRATVFLLSDFYTQEDFSKAVQIANSKHDMIAVQVYDPRAKTLPNIGLMKVKDAETGHEMIIDTGSAKLRQAHTQYWLERQATLRELFSKSKVDWTSVATNEDFTKALMLLFKKRA